MDSKLLRKIHIYLSLICFSFLFFFCFTAITLNHPRLISSEIRTHSQQLPLIDHSPSTIQTVLAKQDIYLTRQQILNLLTETELEIARPGIRHDFYFDEQTKQIDYTVTEYGLITMLNELHQNRHTPLSWTIISDAIAIIIMLICISGTWLSLRSKKQRKLYLTLIIGSVLTLVVLA